MPVFLLAACADAREAAPTEPATVASPARAPSPRASAAVRPANAVRIESDDGLLEFSYSHPAEVGAVPALAAILTADRDEALAEARKFASADSSTARREDYPYNPHALAIEWEVVTQTPRFLSLSNSFYTFTGGAHGNYGVSGLLWDRVAGRRIDALDLFTSRSAFAAAVREPLCQALDQERRKKGIDPPAEDSAFPRCIDPATDAAVIPGSSNRRAFDRIGFLIGPYAAGSYGEGSYEVTLPVTGAILAAVKPEYRDAFALP